MKKLAIILVSVVGSAVLVGVGWWLGFGHRFLTDASAVPIVDRQLSETVMLTHVINDLDSGKVGDARDLLAMQLEHNILSIDSLLDYTDSRTHAFALKVFSGLSEVRAKNPSGYTGPLAKADAEVNAKIESILQKAKNQQPK